MVNYSMYSMSVCIYFAAILVPLGLVQTKTIQVSVLWEDSNEYYNDPATY